MEAVNESRLLMEIERELAGEGRMEALARYDSVLARLDGRIAEAMKSGLPPDDYTKVESLKEANILARKILRLTARVGKETRKA